MFGLRVKPIGWNVIHWSFKPITVQCSFPRSYPNLHGLNYDRELCRRSVLHAKQVWCNCGMAPTSLKRTMSLYADSLIYNEKTEMSERDSATLICMIRLKPCNFKSDYIWKSSSNDTLDTQRKQARIIRFQLKLIPWKCMADTIFLLPGYLRMIRAPPLLKPMWEF